MMIAAPLVPAAFVPSIITTYGAIHTVISLLPVLIGLYLYLTKGTIDLKTQPGKAYWLTAMIGTVTGLFIFHHGGFGPPHAVTLFMVVIMLVAAAVTHILKAKTRTLEIICMSLSYFFLWFFTTTETLTRFPKAHPFASDPAAPALIPVRLVLLVLMVVGIWLQLRAEKKKVAAR